MAMGCCTGSSRLRRAGRHKLHGAFHGRGLWAGQAGGRSRCLWQGRGLRGAVTRCCGRWHAGAAHRRTSLWKNGGSSSDDSERQRAARPVGGQPVGANSQWARPGQARPGCSCVVQRARTGHGHGRGSRPAGPAGGGGAAARGAASGRGPMVAPCALPARPRPLLRTGWSWASGLGMGLCGTVFGASSAMPAGSGCLTAVPPRAGAPLHPRARASEGAEPGRGRACGGGGTLTWDAGCCAVQRCGGGGWGRWRLGEV